MKTDLIQEMDDDMPETIRAFLNTPIGEVVNIPIPTTKDTAVIACGQLAANLNSAFLKPFVGLTPIELFMRIGSKNPVFISSLLSGLEVIAGAGGKLTVISPADGAVVPTWFDAGFVCKGSGIKSAVVSVDGTELTLSADGDTWNATLATPLSIGAHTATFTATYGDGSTADKTVNFEATANMELVSTFPENESSYLPEEVDRVEVVLSEDAAAQNESVNVSIFGQTLTLSSRSGSTYQKDLAELNLSLADFLGLNVMMVSYENADGTKNEEIKFMLSGGEEGGE